MVLLQTSRDDSLLSSPPHYSPDADEALARHIERLESEGQAEERAIEAQLDLSTDAPAPSTADNNAGPGPSSSSSVAKGAVGAGLGGTGGGRGMKVRPTEAQRRAMAGLVSRGKAAGWLVEPSEVRMRGLLWGPFLLSGNPNTSFVWWADCLHSPHPPPLPLLYPSLCRWL